MPCLTDAALLIKSLLRGLSRKGGILLRLWNIGNYSVVDPSRLAIACERYHVQRRFPLHDHRNDIMFSSKFPAIGGREKP
jgi:hypothetical protein